MAAFASRFTGSSDLYESDGRHPSASINFVTAHDGFTLADLVSYNEKHNEANGEDNQDGTDDNRSWNCGVEGPTDDPEVIALRERQQRNFLATLLLSQGVPMISAGDEIGRTQHGNNNAWCQDNEISWIDWELDEPARGAARVHAPAARSCAASIPIFHRTKFLDGKGSPSGLPDAWWFRPDGRRMTAADWNDGNARSLGVFLNGKGLGSVDAHGEPIVDRSFLLLLNAHHEDIVVLAAAAPLRPALAGRAVDRLSGRTGDAADGARLRARGRAVDPAAARAGRCGAVSARAASRPAQGMKRTACRLQQSCTVAPETRRRSRWLTRPSYS